jgi:hypothetical protein
LGVGRGVADHSLRGSADYALFERKRLTVLTDGDMQQIPAVATPGSSVLINILGNRVRASQQVGRTRSTVPHFPHPEVLLQVRAKYRRSLMYHCRCGQNSMPTRRAGSSFTTRGAPSSSISTMPTYWPSPIAYLPKALVDLHWLRPWLP